MGDRVCVVGAGPAGLTAVKNLRAVGLNVDCYERESALGGVWNYGSQTSAAYASTHLISSKTRTAYTDFPMPAHYPPYPRHDLVLAYLNAYTDHFDVRPHIRFGVNVERAERQPDGTWHVRTSDGHTRPYRALILANGHLHMPFIPTLPGHFHGQSLHAKAYKTPDILRGKRVLIVGAGNSGCDIAVEAAQHAQKVYHSMRRGYHYIPKFIFGQPTDVINEIGYTLRLPTALRRWVNTLLIQLVLGRPEQFGLPKPDHPLLASHPIVNSQLLYTVGHGGITPKPDVAELCGDSVRFTDDSHAQIDLVIYATGYQLSFPFMDRADLNWREGDPGPTLYLHCFHPTCDTLFVIGLVEPDSGIFWLMDYQAQAVARLLTAPPHRAAAFRAQMSKRWPNLRGGNRYLPTRRHFYEVDHVAYRRAIQRLISHLGQR